ncbi:MAG TPA: cyclase family protein [Myxococcaceae bacterium]|nr:cyclase family protein [Myxococcaceae bacterium]
MEGAWLDISVPFEGEPLPVQAEEVGRWEAEPARASWTFQVARQMGTFVEAPPKVELDTADTEQLPLTATVGRARVLHLDDVDCIRADTLAAYEPREGERLLLRTRNSLREWWKRPHDDDFVVLSEAAGRLLRERKVACVGVDYVAHGGFHAGGTLVHEELRKAGVWVIEGLDLSEVEPGPHELVCLPLHVKGAWGSPARALVRALRE